MYDTQIEPCANTLRSYLTAPHVPTSTDTTTLHCINSTIVKLGKLTEVRKVYRGISGGVLPDEFWTPNMFNVRAPTQIQATFTTLL